MKPSMCSLKTDTSSPSLLLLMICVQFAVSFWIFVMATVGVSIGAPVASYFLLALLQTIITMPGVVYLFIKSEICVALYAACQLVCGASELYWMFYLMAHEFPFSSWISLLILSSVQITATLIALLFKDLKVRRSKVKKAARRSGEEPSTKSSRTPERSRSDRSREKVVKPKVSQPKPKPKKKSNSGSSSSKSVKKSSKSQSPKSFAKDRMESDRENP
ncbi:unnamed protein product [Caenorhabditis bovis]|uniref:Uncharacterized protein n=1 Tax=Caenorhabditis bovis TaxID=2654633 RepID=A0A8S1F137_9PELO|nr:unnamed protein product [Caenorhabditis bovis]CAB3407399.1 unnamed protein product [Caenorhabditis bovis]